MSPIWISIFLCFFALLFLLWMLRRDQVSLGLPVAYLFSLLLIHVPGAYVHAVRSDLFNNTELIEIGIGYTAIGSLAFAAGVWLARRRRLTLNCEYRSKNSQFWAFCLIGGWFFVYALSPLGSIPSLGAAIEKGGAIWILGVMLGLRDALRRSHQMAVTLWLFALAVYPTLMLLFGGFMSYGTTATIIALSALTIITRSYAKMLGATIIIGFLCISFFVNYFAARDEIRAVVWSGAGTEQRVEVVTNAFVNPKLFSTDNDQHVMALNERLNQNYFTGLAAQRIEDGDVEFLGGTSVWAGVIALVPRAIWPGKPVFAGSPKIVSEMTGLYFSKTTSFGVGNVMELYIFF